MAPRGGFKSKETVLANYQESLAKATASGADRIDVRPFTSSQELLLMDALLHPTKKAESLALTHRLLTTLAEVRIGTTAELCILLGCHDVPIRKRIAILRKYGLTRQESRIYHLATPRLDDFVNNYLGSVVKWVS